MEEAENAKAAAALERERMQQDKARHEADLARSAQEQAVKERAHQEALQQQEAATMLRLQKLEEVRRADELRHKQYLADEQARYEQRITTLHATYAATISRKEAAFAAACDEKTQRRLANLSEEEKTVQAKIEAMLQSGPKNTNKPITIIVCGDVFWTTWNNMSKFPRSRFFEALRQHQEEHGANAADEPLYFDGSLRCFQLILDYLRSPEQLPIFQDATQLQWLEREASTYNLTDLVAMCRDAYKRLDAVDVMQTLNGALNLTQSCYYMCMVWHEHVLLPTV